jgi:hypothetical protein
MKLGVGVVCGCLSLGACGSDDSGNGGNGNQGSGGSGDPEPERDWWVEGTICFESVNYHCQKDDCPESLEEEKARLASQTSRCDGGTTLRTYRYGTCGSHDYVQEINGSTVFTFYFDDEGNLTGGAVDASATFCKTATSLYFGQYIDCSLVQEFDACDPVEGPGGAGGQGN